MTAYFAIPGDLALPTGGYEYARRVLQALPQLEYLALPQGFPKPSEAELIETGDLLARLAPQDTVLFDGLALGALPPWCLSRFRGRLVALVHHPLCLEHGLKPSEAAALQHSETRALSRAAHIITTSASTASLLACDFAVPLERLSVAEPGTPIAARAPRSGQPQRLLAVGAIASRKGYDVLIEALAGCIDLDWHLTIAGDLTRNPVTAMALHAGITARELAQRITLTGAIAPAALAQLYADADIFVSASRYEGYGMAAAEALSYGLPIVATQAGALVDTIPAAAALMCPPGDASALKHALAKMLTDDLTQTRCADAAWEAGQRLPRWEQTAAIIKSLVV